MLKGKVTINSNTESSQNEIEVRTEGTIYSLSGEFVVDSNALLNMVKEKYQKEGTQFFKDIEGNFSIEIIDHTRGELILVRDKIGTVPLYYSIGKNVIYWANRIKDIISNAEFEVLVNEDVIHEYLVFRFIGGKNTLFKNIHEVRPSHYTRINLKDGSVNEIPYWDFPYPVKHEMIWKDADFLIERIDEVLRGSIKKSFMEGMRNGMLLSGGVDSSLIVAIASEILGESIPTFFIGFSNYDSDRSLDARIVAEKYNTTHSTFYINAEQYAEGLPESIKINEEPLNHPGHVGRVLFNKFIQNKIDSLYLGEGVDTMFCGSKVYPLIKYAYIYNPFRTISKSLFKIISPEFIPVSIKRYYNMIRDAFVMDPVDYVIKSISTATYSKANNLLVKKNDLTYLEYYKGYLLGYNKQNILEKILRFNQHPFMVEVLNSEAKFAYQYTILNRYPFLDIELISLANSIPFDLRNKGLTGKYIIKKLAERYLPRKLIYKRKEGLGVPLKNFFSNPNGMGRYYDFFLDRKTRERGIFNFKELTSLVDKHWKNEMPDNSYEGLLWTAINLELWFRLFLDKHETDKNNRFEFEVAKRSI